VLKKSERHFRSVASPRSSGFGGGIVLVLEKHNTGSGGQSQKQTRGKIEHQYEVQSTINARNPCACVVHPPLRFIRANPCSSVAEKTSLKNIRGLHRGFA